MAIPTEARIGTQGLSLGKKISRHSLHSPTSCLLLSNPATFFVLEQKGQKGKEQLMKNKPKEGSGDWESSTGFSSMGAREKDSESGKAITNTVPPSPAAPTRLWLVHYSHFPASGVVQMREFYSCLSFISLFKLGMVGLFPFFVLPFFLASLSLSFLRLCS